MLRILFIVLLLIHGIIHLPGFARESGWRAISQPGGKTLILFSGSTARLAGVFWLVACILFVLAAGLYYLQKDWWWIVAACAVLLSQVLVVLYWADARFGTIINLVILIVLIPAWGWWNFQNMARKELAVLLPTSLPKAEKVTQEMITPLPFPVRKWLEKSGMVGREMIHTAYSSQYGTMRTTPEGKWMEVKADQYVSAAEPGFIWLADVTVNPLIHLYGRDKYMDGKGHMLIRMLGLFAVADARGKAIDQGTMLRYLGECVWYPSAAFSKYIHWTEIDSATAKAEMNYKGVSASGIFHFDTSGDFRSFQAKRYYDRKEGATLEDWLVVADTDSYREFEGIRIPSKITVTWRLKAGDFTWYRMEVKKQEYNKPYIR